MEFINQVKKLKETTKSPEVKKLCENFLNGQDVPENLLIEKINEHNSIEMNQNSPENSIRNHADSIKREESEISKKAAQALMESWGGLKNSGSGNSGSYNSINENQSADSDFVEKIKSVSDSDGSARSFVKSQGVRDLGIKSAIEKISESSIYTYPKVKVFCDQYLFLMENKGIPEFSLINNFISEMESFSWDSSVAEISKDLKGKASEFSREIEVSKVLEAIKNSGSHSFYSDLTETLNEWLVSENKSSGLLVRNIEKYNFNPVVRNLINFLNINESQNSNSLSIPVLNQEESFVGKVFSPVLFENGRTFFYLGKSIFEADENSIRKLSHKEISSMPDGYLKLINTLGKGGMKINEEGIFVNFGKKIVRIVEENESVSVYLGKDKLRFNDPVSLAKILGLESASYFGVNESEVVGDVMNLYSNYYNIVELDFAKSITSKIYEGLQINLFKWKNQIFLQKINEGMRENSLYKVNGTQAVSMVKNFMRYDISEGLTEFLEGEFKIKSIMINDRNKILENIDKVETELTKIESLMESNPLYKNSREIQTAQKMLENELQILRNKWNQINIELNNIDSEISSIDNSNIFEDERFGIGTFVKIKESGDTGKIISIDGNSGRYTVLLDSGRTEDYLVNEMSDLEEALNKAADDNEKSDKYEDDSETDVKESNNFNKSDLSEDEQKKILKNLSNMHGFSKAPKSDNETIEMELDTVHGYNISMNEAKKDSAKAETGNKTSKTPLAKAPGDSKISRGTDKNKKNLEVAPGNNKKAKGKVEGDDTMAEAPDSKNPKTKFRGKDELGDSYDIGVNLRESEEVKKK
jgi:hypothetical protein